MKINDKELEIKPISSISSIQNHLKKGKESTSNETKKKESPNKSFAEHLEEDLNKK